MLYLKYFSKEHIIISDGETEKHLYAKGTDEDYFDQDTIEAILEVAQELNNGKK